MRMQHYAIFLQGFNFTIKYRNSKHNCNADCLSRLPLPEFSEKRDVVDCFYNDTIYTLPVTHKELVQENKKDTQIRDLIVALKSNQPLQRKDFWNIEPCEFAVENDVLVRAHRVVVPKTLQRKILIELHSGHFGIVKMKSLARGYCWWHNIDKDIENLVSNCKECQLRRNNPHIKEKHIWEPATSPFERVHVDFAGPYLGRILFILVDSYTKWPEVYITKDMTAPTVIDCCTEIFSRFGIPKILVSDNGSAFISDLFKNFLRANGIKHKLTAPFNPKTNGQAERYVQTIKYALSKIQASKNFKNEMHNMLFTYRILVHSTTNRSPSELMFARKVRCKLDLLKEKSNFKPDSLYSAGIFFSKGEKVAVRNYYGKIKWLFGTVKERIGDLHYYVELENGTICKRYYGQMRKIGNNLIKFDELDFYIPYENSIATNLNNNIENVNNELIEESSSNNDNVQNADENEQNIVTTRSGRVSKTPAYLKDNYVLEEPKS